MRTSKTVPAPAPGFYPEYDEHAYHSMDALGQSEMKKGIWGSMADFKAAQDAPPTDPSPDMVLGTLAGLAIFQPDKYATKCVDGPINPKTGQPFGAASDAYKDFAERARGAGKTVIGGDHRGRVAGMVAAVKAHPLARKLLAAPGHSEAVAVWDEQIPGFSASVRGKAAADRLITGGAPRRVELKTTSDIAEDAWSKKVNDLGYHIQDAWYQRGFNKVLSTPMEPAFLIVVQNCEPFGVSVDVIRREAVEMANTLIDEFLVDYHGARTTMHWPGHGWMKTPGGLPGEGSYQVREIDIPKWAYGAFNDGL